MKVAAVQTVSGLAPGPNLARAELRIREAAQAGAELVVLPEYFCQLGQRDTDKLAIAEPAGRGPMQQWAQDLAAELRIWLVAGTLPLRAEDANHVRNTLLVYSPQGACAARYDKIHLFRFDNGQERYDESRVIEAGASVQVLELDSRDGARWRVGLSVCYDLRFPELYRRMHADLILVPSAFTHTTGQAHWEVLLRARAIENQAYVLAPAQGGVHENGRRTWGHSLGVDPWGSVLACLDEGEGTVIVDMDMARLRAVRAQLPALEHRVFG